MRNLALCSPHAATRPLRNPAGKVDIRKFFCKTLNKRCWPESHGQPQQRMNRHGPCCQIQHVVICVMIDGIDHAGPLFQLFDGNFMGPRDSDSESRTDFHVGQRGKFLLLDSYSNPIEIVEGEIVQLMESENSDSVYAMISTKRGIRPARLT